MERGGRVVEGGVDGGREVEDFEGEEGIGLGGDDFVDLGRGRE